MAPPSGYKLIRFVWGCVSLVAARCFYIHSLAHPFFEPTDASSLSRAYERLQKLHCQELNNILLFLDPYFSF